MTKVEYIERYGIEAYELHKARTNIKNKVRNKERYNKDSEYRERTKAYNRERKRERYNKDSEYRERTKAYNRERKRERYKNDLEYRERMKKEYKELLKNEPKFREYYREYLLHDLNSNGQTKHYIRTQSNRILFKIRHHTKIKGYEIHHCFGYDDPSKFIYIPKSLHVTIHQYLRDNNIDADSNHYDYIKYMINECDEYTYISI